MTSTRIINTKDSKISYIYTRFNRTNDKYKNNKYKGQQDITFAKGLVESMTKKKKKMLLLLKIFLHSNVQIPIFKTWYLIFQTLNYARLNIVYVWIIKGLEISKLQITQPFTTYQNVKKEIRRQSFNCFWLPLN